MLKTTFWTNKNQIFCKTSSIVQSKRGEGLKFAGSVEDHEGYNISENQPDLIKYVGSTSILVKTTQKGSFWAPKTGPTRQTVMTRR